MSNMIWEVERITDEGLDGPRFEVTDMNFDVCIVHDEETAYLIAAAPRMQEHLKNILDLALDTEMDVDHILHAIQETAKAAIQNTEIPQ